MRMKWAGHVERMEEKGKYTGIWFESLKEGERLEDLDVDGRMAFKWRLKKTGWGEIWDFRGSHNGGNFIIGSTTVSISTRYCYIFQVGSTAV